MNNSQKYIYIYISLKKSKKIASKQIRRIDFN